MHRLYAFHVEEANRKIGRNIGYAIITRLLIADKHCMAIDYKYYWH